MSGRNNPAFKNADVGKEAKLGEMADAVRGVIVVEHISGACEERKAQLEGEKKKAG